MTITLTIALILFLVYFIFYLVYRGYCSHLKRWQKNLKPGDRVAFYVGEERRAGKVLYMVDDLIYIEHLGKTYTKVIHEIYFL